MRRRVEQMIRRILGPLDHSDSGARNSIIDIIEQRFGVTFPTELREWLGVCNGCSVGYGRTFGVHPKNANYDLEATLQRYPEWIDSGWLPVAADGSGNYYVLDTKTERAGKHPVYFVEPIQSREEPAYIVGSGLWEFLWFFLDEAMRETGLDAGETRNPSDAEGSPWPFDRDWVAQRDPDIEGYAGVVSLPWEEEL